MTLWSYIVFFIIPIVLQSIIIVLLSAVFPIKLLASNMWFHSLFGRFTLYMHIVQINQWIFVDIESRAFENVPNADITGNMTSNDYFLQLQNYTVYLQQRSL